MQLQAHFSSSAINSTKRFFQVPESGHWNAQRLALVKTDGGVARCRILTAYAGIPGDPWFIPIWQPAHSGEFTLVGDEQARVYSLDQSGVQLTGGNLCMIEWLQDPLTQRPPTDFSVTIELAR